MRRTQQCVEAEHGVAVLSGKGHQGRTVQWAENSFAARLLVGDATFIVVLSEPGAWTYLDKGQRLDDHHRGGGNHDSGNAPLGSAFREVAHPGKILCLGPV